jgi:hypothetical protein
MNHKNIPLIKAKKTLKKDIILDPNGFFIIGIFSKEIRVEFYENVYKNNKIVSGILKKVFVGLKADALCDTIAENIKNLRIEHYMYLGRELYKAEIALINNTKYIQGGC